MNIIVLCETRKRQHKNMGGNFGRRVRHHISGPEVKF